MTQARNVADFANNVTAGGTGAITLPVGTTAQRPASPSAGMARYNTSSNKLEVYQNGNC